jgi:hypothetical protein
MQTHQQEHTSKQRRTRSDTGPRITERDLQALRWIAQQYTISLDHLSILLARLIDPQEYTQKPKQAGELTDKRTAAVVRRWEQLGLVEKAWILHNEPAWLWLTPQGLKLIAEDLGQFRPYKPNPARLNHLYWCNHARLFIEAKRQDAIWTSERELAAGQQVERGKKRPHLPDAIVTTSDSREVAIEVELTTKTYSRLDTILHELARSSYSRIWYMTRERSTTVMKTAIGAMHEMYRDKFVVYDLDQMSL